MAEPERDLNYIDLENVPVVFEEIENSEFDLKELTEFVEANTLSNDDPAEISESVFVNHVINEEYPESDPEEYEEDDLSPQKSEDVWINKLMNGEGTYIDYNEPLEIDDLEDDSLDDKCDIMENFDREVSQSRKDALKGNIQGFTSSSTSPEKFKRKRRFLPPALQGLMGQANLCYARGDNELAEKVCLEIIRQVPLAPEPYFTLAQIYETKDTDKFLQFSLIAAHLNPSEVEQWLRIAEISIEQGNNIKQAITCYNKAIKADPKNIDLRIRRIELLESIGEEKYAQRCYFSMLAFIPKEQSEYLIETAKKCAQKYHSDNNITNAIEAMNRAYTTASDSFKTEDINLFLELLILGKSYHKALDIISNHTPIVIHKSEDNANILDVIIPKDLLLDFRTKFVVILIHLHSFHLMDYLINDIFTNIDVEDDGDCYLDIGEALMSEKKYELALKFLSPLVKSTNYNLAAVWLRYADSNRAIENDEESINAYRMVVNMAPKHLEARLTLAALLKKKLCYNEALLALEQNPESDILDPELLYEKCQMLYEMGRINEFIESGYLLITRHSYRLRSRLEMAAVLNCNRFNLRINSLRDIRETRCEPVEDVNCPEFLQSSEGNVIVENEWQLFNNLLKCAYNIERYDLFQKLAFTAMSSRKFQAYNKELEFIVVLSCIYNKDPVFGYNLVREYISKNINNPRVWNLFNLAIMITDDIRYIRFLVRLFERVQAPTMPHALEANYYLSSGTYKYALNDYISAYKKTKEPMLAMLASVTLTQIASQKYSSNKLSLITQAIAFMDDYRKLRESDAQQEIHYNFGRMYQQLNLYSAAIDHYKRALETDCPLIRSYPEYLDLKREIAFNLHLIYKSSGNYDLARKYLYDYIEI